MDEERKIKYDDCNRRDKRKYFIVPYKSKLLKEQKRQYKAQQSAITESRQVQLFNRRHNTNGFENIQSIRG